MRNFLFILLTTLLCISCNKNYYSEINYSNFKKGENQYVFKDFTLEGNINENQQLNGRGKFWFKDGTIIEGNFTNGVLNDKNAMVIIPNYGIIKGESIDGIIAKGEIQFQKAGTVYTGGIKKYEANGKGVLVYNQEHNYKKYIGEFENNYFDGLGIIETKNNEQQIIATFENGKFNGEVFILNSKNKEIETKIYELGKDVTRIKKEEYISNYIEKIERAETRSIDSIINENNSLKRYVETEIANGPEIAPAETVCECYLKTCGYLTVQQNPKYNEQYYKWKDGFGTKGWEYIGDKDIYYQWYVYHGYSKNDYDREIEEQVEVLAPTGITRNEIQSLLIEKKKIVMAREQKESELRAICKKWKENPKLYEQAVLEAKYPENMRDERVLNSIIEQIKVNQQQKEEIKKRQIQLKSDREKKAQEGWNNKLKRLLEKRKKELCVRLCLCNIDGSPIPNAKVTCQ
jgi:hypothetical protein